MLHIIVEIAFKKEVGGKGDYKSSKTTVSKCHINLTESSSNGPHTIGKFLIILSSPGMNFSLHRFIYRTGKSSIGELVVEVSNAIIEELGPEYLKVTYFSCCCIQAHMPQ
jgi:hypothetical protein